MELGALPTGARKAFTSSSVISPGSLSRSEAEGAGAWVGVLDVRFGHLDGIWEKIGTPPRSVGSLKDCLKDLKSKSAPPTGLPWPAMVSSCLDCPGWRSTNKKNHARSMLKMIYINCDYTYICDVLILSCSKLLFATSRPLLTTPPRAHDRAGSVGSEARRGRPER